MGRHRAIIAAILMFTLGVTIDAWLRAPEKGITNCFVYGSLSSRIVFVADHPLVSMSHPVETINLFLSD